VTRQRDTRLITPEVLRMVQEKSVGRLSCPLCPGRFKTVGEKKRHIRTDHDREKK
jgi:hypothetical protein